MAISIVLADEHPVVLKGLEQVFAAEPDFVVSACCGTGDEALEAVRRLNPDLLLADIHMPGRGALSVLGELQHARLRTRVIIFTAGLEDTDLLEAVRLGARGVVLRENPPAHLVRCAREVDAGALCLDNGLSVRALQRVVQARNGPASDVLTPRELEIVRALAGGLRNKQIAARLSVTEGTIKVHLHRIYKKLRVDGRLALIIHAQQKGLLER